MIELSAGNQSWPIDDLLTGKDSLVIENLHEQFGELPTGAWDDPPTRALLLPIISQTQGIPAGVIVIGLNPYRPLDVSYAGFLNLIAGQIAGSIANARAYEEEKQRAEALAEIDRAKTVFFSNVSHEFRTPLTLMLGPLEDLASEKDKLSPAHQQQLAIAQRNSVRLLKLVNSLLDFSRIEAGRVQAVYEPTNLGEFTSELASTFQSAMERAGLSFEVKCEQIPEPIFVDRDMWEKIVFNLLSNALKFTLSGSVSVDFADHEGTVRLEVRDTGIGIPEKELPRLFERFHRVEGAHGRTQEGTGIGLALVQELAKLHGGSVTAESVEGRGSTFRVLIPKGKDHLPAERVGAARNLPSTALLPDAYLGEVFRWLPDSSAVQTMQCLSA